MGREILKSASGKTGNLMETITDPNYGKDTRGEAKGKIFMPSNDIIDTEGRSMKDIQKRQQKFHQNKNLAEITEAYNADLYNLDPKYSGLKITNNKILIRLKRIPMKSESGLLMNLPMIHKPSEQPNAPGELVESPFPYEPVGVVVAVDNNDSATANQSFSVGDTVQLDQNAMYFQWDVYRKMWDWKIAFWKWDERDGFFGYVLVREYDIQCKLNEKTTDVPSDTEGRLHDGE